MSIDSPSLTVPISGARPAETSISSLPTAAAAAHPLPSSKQQKDGGGGGGCGDNGGGAATAAVDFGGGADANIEDSTVPTCIEIVVSMDDAYDDALQGPTRLYFRKLEASSPLTWCPTGDSDDDVWLFYVFVLTLIRQILRADVGTSGAKDVLGSFDRAGIDAGLGLDGKTRTHLDHFDWIRELMRLPHGDVPPPCPTLKSVLDEPLVQVFLGRRGRRGDVVQALKDCGVSLMKSLQLNVVVTDKDQIADIWARYPRPKPDTTAVVKATVRLRERECKGPAPRELTTIVDVSAMVQVTDTWESVVDCIKAKVFDESDNPKVALIPLRPLAASHGHRAARGCIR